MTDHGRSSETDPEEAIDPLPPPDPVKGSTFRQDGGPGSVKRERQPGFGGMDARPAEESEGHWQNLTSDRYGHVIKPETEDAVEED